MARTVGELLRIANTFRLLTNTLARQERSKGRDSYKGGGVGTDPSYISNGVQIHNPQKSILLPVGNYICFCNCGKLSPLLNHSESATLHTFMAKPCAFDENLKTAA